MPAMLGLGPASPSLPFSLDGSDSRVLLVLDGLGWEQMKERPECVPTLGAMEGGPITSVAPSTTAAALTSITTGLTPGEHGIVGYRMMIDGEVLNTLRWGTKERQDCRRTVPPASLQPFDPFVGQTVDYVSRAEFRTSGFTGAHLRGSRLHGYRTTAVMLHEINRVVREGAPFVYAYYDGIDKVAHEYGLGSTYGDEVAFADRLVADLLGVLPAGTELIVTADHGQVDCGTALLPVDDSVLSFVAARSGEARFRWLHARPGAGADLFESAVEAHSKHAWVATRDQILDEGWFGRHVRDEVADRLGDVALLPFEPIGFDDPDDGGPFPLIGRHGSLTAAEMLVPLVRATV